MEFEDLKGIGEKTADKLREAGFTLENIKEATIEDITTKTDIHESLANEIIQITQDLTGDSENNPNRDHEIETTKEHIKHDISKAKKYLVRAFEKSEYYDEENKEEAYSEWFDDLLKKNNRFRR